MKKFKDGDEVEFEYGGKIHVGVVDNNGEGSLILYNNLPSLNNGQKTAKMYGFEGYWYCRESDYKIRKKGEKYIEKLIVMPRAYIGSDPEFFFMEKGKVLASELVLPKESISTGSGKLTIDGVQAEINPSPDTCRESHAMNISRMIRYAKTLLKDGQSISFDPLVPIKLTVLNKLSDKAKFFGCTPSYNAYDNDNKMSIDDSSMYPFRPAGGHLHFGHSGREDYIKIFNDIKTLIPMLDIIVGNTCVLIDRHEGNKERRKCYGRAGEFRTPKHGIEYRTLSNFWLKAYPLMSFVFALSRMAMDIINSSTKKDNFVKEIMDSVDINDIRNAINNNDFDLALNNFSKIKPILERIATSQHPLHADNMKNFLYFVGKVKKDGLEYWFKKDPVEYWCDVAEGNGRGNGWERFLVGEVSDDMAKSVSKKSKIIKKLNLD